MGTSTENNTVRAVDRTLDIIEALAKAPRGMQLINLAEAVGLHKTTTYRLLCSLVQRNYVVKDEETGKYRLTLRLFQLSSQIINGFNIRGAARPYLEKISDKTGEVVHLVARDGVDVVYLHKEDPSSCIVHMGSRIGARNPMYCTGVGKSILAGMPEQEVRKIWDKSTIIQRTPFTITSYDCLQEELEKVRQRGYAIDDQENEMGVRCVAASILNSEGNPFAAISVAAAVERMPDAKVERYAKLVLSATEHLSALFGN